MRIFAESPLMFAKNAIVNSAMGFSPGYIVKGGDFANYSMGLIGFVVFLLMMVSRQFALAIAIIVSCSTYTLYFPPVPAYLYGNYLLLSYALIVFFERSNWKSTWKRFRSYNVNFR